MICRLVNKGQGCRWFHPTEGCSAYNRGGVRFRARQGYCPLADDGPNKKVVVTNKNRVRAGQQKQKKA